MHFHCDWLSFGKISYMNRHFISFEYQWGMIECEDNTPSKLLWFLQSMEKISKI